VETVGKPFLVRVHSLSLVRFRFSTGPPAPKPALPAPIREEGVRNRLRARIFTVDIRRRERKIPAIRFPTQLQIAFPGLRRVCG